MPKFDIKNATCFYYLQDIRDFYIQNKSLLFPQSTYPENSPEGELKKTMSAIFENGTTSSFKDYNPSENYKDHYSLFQAAIEKVALAQLETEGNNPTPTIFDELFLKIYENKNRIREKLGEALGMPGTSIEVRKILQENQDKGVRADVAKVLNAMEERAAALFSSMLGIRYHPLKDENIPYMNENVLIGEREIKNLRFGNQTQGSETVNPTFKRYLIANQRRSTTNQRFDYVYINLLKRDQEQTRQKAKPTNAKEKLKEKYHKRREKFVRGSEGARARALESLNEQENLGVAVITLPADNDFLLGNIIMKDASEKNPKKEDLMITYAELVLSIQQNRNDFYMTDDVKARLFGDDFASNPFPTNDTILELFQKSLLDITGSEDLTQQVAPAVRNAVLFHFIKFHLTSHILETLNPTAFNASCKDAIDRGAVHSLWLTLNTRFEAHLKDNKKPVLSLKEFLSMLESPAMIVKNRGVNHNKNLIWNVLKERMAHDPLFAAKHGYLKEWVQENDPLKAHKDTRKSFITSTNGRDKPIDPAQKPSGGLLHENKTTSQKPKH